MQWIGEVHIKQTLVLSLVKKNITCKLNLAKRQEKIGVVMRVSSSSKLAGEMPKMTSAVHCVYICEDKFFFEHAKHKL